MFHDSQHALDEVVQSLATMLQREAAMVAQVQGLSGFTSELESTVAGVRSAAKQINVLAPNAAGEQGRGFAVVADEVRNLAASSSHTGDRNSAKIKEISALMAQTLSLTESSAESDDQLVETSETTMQGALSRLQETMDVLSRDADSLRATSENIGTEISEVLVGLHGFRIA